MNDSNINIGVSLDKNTKSKIQTELDKIKGLNVNIQADASSITSSVEKAINDAFKNIKTDKIKLPEVSSKNTENIFDKYKSGINYINDFINTIDKTKKITELSKNVGRPEMYGLKIC